MPTMQYLPVCNEMQYLPKVSQTCYIIVIFWSEDKSNKPHFPMQ